MIESKRRQYATASIHIITWLLLVVVVVYFSSVDSIGSEKGTRLAALIACMAATYYVHHFFLIPRFFLQRQFAVYALISLLILAVMWFAPEFLYEPAPPLDFPSHPPTPGGHRPPPPRAPRFLLVFMTLLTTLLSITIRLISNWQAREKKEVSLQASQLKTELNFLKNQVSPHFFFNTLNSIYALTETDPEQARKVIHRLSKLMRYLLYESEQAPRVPIHRETDFLNAYVDLMKIRLPESVQVDYQARVQNPNALIPPLLLLPLVENAFKHGVSMKEPVSIHLELKQERDAITLITVNSNTASENFEKGGIGLTNLKRRLELIYDAEDYELSTTDGNATFRAHLKLKTWDSTAS